MTIDNGSDSKRALIFDMDGTIVNNMAYHSASWVQFFKNRSQAIDEEAFFLATAGRQNAEIMRLYVRHDLNDAELAQLAAEKEGLYRDLYRPHLQTIAGFETLIERAKADGLILAVATSAPNDNINFTLDGLDIRKHFHAVVGAADVKRGKPEPDVFLKAAERCGVSPDQCIVFEDAPLGVEAARRAGMRAVVLTTTMPASAFAGYDNVIAIVEDFNSLSLGTFFASQFS
ncbi:MAG: HAD family phosphatase [Pseudomonadota bacterium]